jgi:hypothetical protein
VLSLEAARDDLVKQRSPEGIPNPCRPAILVATGDSLTSAHHQTADHLDHCGSTASDPVRKKRPMVGNDGFFSYAGKYFDANPQLVEYYNFARTGFSLNDMTRATAATTDGCGQAWGRNQAPATLAATVIAQAKRDNRLAYFVTTGGINDTNWVQVMSETITCRAMHTMRREQPRFQWFANGGGGKENVVPNGGSCVATAAWPIGEIYRNAIPAFSANFAVIGANAQTIVHQMLTAGADRVVWMLYYDLNPALISIRHLVAHQLGQNPRAPRFFDIARLGDGIVPVVDPIWKDAAIKIQTDLNAAIVKTLPQNLPADLWAKVRLVTPHLGTDDIQRTAKGGSPHPSDAGHQKMAKLLGNAIDGPATGIALRAHANNKYVTAQQAGSLPLLASGAAPGPWESFQIVDLRREGADRYVALLSLSNHNYVAAEEAGAKPLIANRAVVGAWETFQLIENADRSISFKSMANNKYVTAENAGADPLIANRAAIGAWEKFSMGTSPSGYLLKARSNNKHVSVADVSGAPIKASSTTPGPWETFHIIEVRREGANRFVALLSQANYQYVAAEEAGAKPLVANRSAIGAWETFQLITNANGTYSLKAQANNMYVTAPAEPTSPLIANCATIDPLNEHPWEQFELIPWNTPPQP